MGMWLISVLILAQVLSSTSISLDGKNGKKQNNKVSRFFDKDDEPPKKAFTKGAF